MPLWGNRDQYSDAPKFTTQVTNGQTGQQQYGNTVFLADNVEVSVNKAIAAPGWVRRTVGTGAVASITITSGGTLYANADTITVSGGATNAAANVVTNGNGVITAVNVTNPGSGFTSAPTIAVTTSTGSNATFAAVLNGRAGRVSWETLVAISGPITTDAVSFSNTSTANVANSTGTADDSVLPDA
jgi:hypothetical protein